MKNQSKFLDVFLRGGGPTLELLGAFGLGLLVIGLLSNWLYDFLKTPVEMAAKGGAVLAGCVVLTAFAYTLYWRDAQRKVTLAAVIDESRRAPVHDGLIWLFGPGYFGHLIHALKYHQAGGDAKHCWLVLQEDSSAVTEALSSLQEQVQAEGIRFQIHPMYIQHTDVQQTYDAVRLIWQSEAKKYGLRPEQVIADMTGGLKLMTAGLVLAAITLNEKLEYVETDRDDAGNFIQGSQRVVLADTSFYLQRGE